MPLTTPAAALSGAGRVPCVCMCAGDWVWLKLDPELCPAYTFPPIMGAKSLFLSNAVALVVAGDGDGDASALEVAEAPAGRAGVGVGRVFAVMSGCCCCCC